MSLLLDALKKAAEQKAQKSQQEEPELSSSDETLIRAGSEDVSGFGEGITGTAQTALDEEDHSDIRNRLESDLSQRIAGDETGFDITDTPETFLDPTQSERAPDDGTGVDVADATETVVGSAPFDPAAGDETGIDVADATETLLAGSSEQMLTGDDETIVFSEDSTVFAEESEVGSEAVIPDDETDISQSATMADDTESTLRQRHHEAGEVAETSPVPESDTEIGADADADQDLSLLLVETQYRDSKTKTSLTEPGEPPNVAELTPGTASGLEDVGLVDKTDRQSSAEQTNTDSTAITSPTAAIGYADDTRRAPGTTQSTLTKVESTSTHTYAPDNYDRTLMKPSSDDASNIFSGIKSDTGVVMTPDYAKKVFRSKTSEQRAQHYKKYAGITTIILLVIGFYGAYEYQEKSSEIDNSLISLKRDPMPGVIKAPKGEDEIALFAGVDTEVNTRTIEIIETASEAETAPDVSTDTVPEVVTEAASPEPGSAEVETQESSLPVTETVSEPVESQQARASEEESMASAGIDQAESPEAETSERIENLHIEMARQVSQSDIWLQEAYAAYQSGNYSKAMQRYNEVLEVDPNNRNALLARAAINVHDGYSEAAIKDYRKLLLINPKDSLAVSSLLTVISYSPQDAETQLKLMIREEPDSPYLNFALANAYGAQNRWREAQEYYFKALQNNPEDPNYAYNLAVSLEHISQPASAITYYQRALENFEKGLATFNREVVDQRLQLLGKL